MEEKRKNKIFIPCEEARHTCDKNQYKEASFWEMIKLNAHLLYCRACRDYTRNNMKLTKIFKSPEVHTMKADEKNALKKRIEEELAK